MQNKIQFDKFLLQTLRFTYTDYGLPIVHNCSVQFEMVNINGSFRRLD
jgi:hypothetical protein